MRLTAAQRVTQAIELGLTTDASELGPHVVRRNLRAKTTISYTSILNLWDAFTCEFPDASPKNIQHLKQFAECVGLSMTGRISKISGKPTTRSVRIKLRWFINAWERKYRDFIPQEIKNSMAPYIEGELAVKLNLVTGKAGLRKKRFFTIEHYVQMQGFHWQSDFHDYAHEGNRLDNTALLNLHCFTSARRAEVCQATYQDVQLILSRTGEMVEFQLKFTREQCKGTDIDQPEHPFSELVLDEDGKPPPLYAQPMFQLLAIIISDKVCPELGTVDDALALLPSATINYRIFEWSDHAKQKAMFPAWARHGPKDGTKSPGAWGNQFSKWAVRVGIPGGLGFHSIRREGLIQANDNGYSMGQIMRFASQRSTNVLINNYLGNISTIDGTSNYLQMEHRTDLADKFRSATMEYNPNLLQTIPANNLQDLQKQQEYLSALDDIQSKKISLQNCQSNKTSILQDDLKAAQDKLRTLEKNYLKELQNTQKLDYTAESGLNDQKDWRRTHYDRIKHMLPPERRRLAHSMVQRLHPRSQDWVSALKDAVHLRTTEYPVAFQDNLRPINGCCPATLCQRSMQSIALNKQWSHVYHCLADELNAKFGYSEFCLLCSNWLTSEVTWKEHCKNHFLESRIPLRCDPVTYRYGTACAGYCPVHLSDTSLAAHKRLKQYYVLSNWERHVTKCISRFITTQAKGKLSPVTWCCPHLLCEKEQYTSENDLWNHLQDIHSIKSLSNGDGVKVKDRLKTGEFNKKFVNKFVSNESNELTSSDIPYDYSDFDSTASTVCGHTQNSVPSDEDTLDDYKPWDSPATIGELKIDYDNMSTCSEQSDDNMSSCSEQSDDETHGVNKIIGQWIAGRKTLYLVEWTVGGISWQPKQDILDQDLISSFQKEYRGFKDSIEILRTREKKGGVEYYIRFLNYVGVHADSEWWVPEQAVHPELHIDHGLGKREGKLTKKH